MVRKGIKNRASGVRFEGWGDRVGYHESGNTPGFVADAREARFLGEFP